MTPTDYGIVVYDTDQWAKVADKFPGVQYAYSYNNQLPDIEGIQNIAFHPTFESVDKCSDYMLSLYSPNMPAPEGHPFLNDEGWNSPHAAVEEFLKIEAKCPDSTHIVFNVSPHAFPMTETGYARQGVYWLMSALDYYYTKTGHKFPHIVGVILSENDQHDKYPIYRQAGDFWFVKFTYNVPMWATFVNSKEGEKNDWEYALYVSQWFDVAFPAMISKDCYRSLYCDDDYTVGGKAVINWIGNEWK